MGIFESIEIGKETGGKAERTITSFTPVVDLDVLWSPAETQEAQETHSEPSDEDGFCSDQCVLPTHRDRWIEKPGRYFDRVLVECGLCGRFVGYRILKSKPVKQEKNNIGRNVNYSNDPRKDEATR
jgi:hypothetical protein